VKLVHLIGLIIKKFVTMHGHMNVKNAMRYTHKISVAKTVADCTTWYTRWFKYDRD